MSTRETFTVRRRHHLLAATMLCAVTAGAGQAQVTAGPQTPPPSDSETQTTAPDAANGFSDIVVTARKRQESLQTVPLTITAFSAAAIQKTDTRTIYDLATRTPGLYYGTTGGRAGGNKLQIRNLSTGTSGGSKASVFIDGVYMSGDYSSTPLVNLERVEVLKGPQSAYFGRSTFVGAVNFVTRDPGAEFAGKLDAIVATQGERDITGFLTTPIMGDTLSNTITGRYFDYRGPDAWTGTDGYHYGNQSTRAVTDKLVLRPMDGLTIRWYNSYVRDRDHIPQTTYAPLNTRNAVVQRPDGTVASYFQGSVNIDHSAANAANLYQTRVNGVITDPGVERKQYRSVLSLDADIAGQKLSAFGAYSNERVRNNYDAYFLGARTETAPNARGVPTPYSYNQSTYYASYQTKDKQAEIRLTSPDDWRLRYTIGYNYTKIYGRTMFVFDPITPAGAKVYATPPLISSTSGTILGNPSETNGVFGALYFDITPKITISAELRHQWDKIRADILPTTFSTVESHYSNTFQSTLPRVNIQYKPTKDLNIYAVYSVGNNPGGFNTNAPVAFLPSGVSQAYGEEKLYNYEAGLKSTMLDGRLTFDIAVYHMDWKNEQVLQSYVTNYPNAGAVTALYTANARSGVTGFEAELNAQATDDLSLRATAAYGKAKYKDYCSSNYYALTGVATALGCRSVAGKQQEGTPALQLSIFADYSHPITDGVTGYFRADYQYQSKIYLEEWNMSWMAPANLVGLRIGAETGHFTGELFVRNLLDDDHSPRTTRASYQPVGGAACSVAATQANTCPAGSYPAVTTVYGTTTAGAAGYQDIADTARRPRQIGVRLGYKF